MPSWKEKPHVTPTINVNLKPCACRSITPYGPASVGECLNTCPGAPVNLPCPIPPSVTFTVRMGECAKTCGVAQTVPLYAEHWSDCPARPIRVSCSISGKTWAGSEVRCCEPERGHGAEGPHLFAICRERWALVKALVTGMHVAPDLDGSGSKASLERQRNEVFAELTALGRLEQAAFEAQERAIRAMGEPTFLPDNFMRAEPHARASASILARYVERLIERAGVLP